MMEVSTKITTVFDKDSQELVTEQIYPLFSETGLPLIRESEVATITKTFFDLKLNRYYDCIKKAKIVAEFFGIKYITLGSLFVSSTEPNTVYGYDYHPPLELHAWLELYNGNIFDFALPGTIEKGLKTKDDIGYFLVGREPVILAGKPASWMQYKSHEKVLIENLNELNKELAKDLLLLWR